MFRHVVVLLGILCLAPTGYCLEQPATVRDAALLVRAGKTDEAERACAKIIEAHPGAPNEPIALLMMGHIKDKRHAPVAEVIAQFKRTVDKFPNSPEAPVALLRIGYLRDRIGQPTDEWSQVVKKYPRTKEAADALHCLGHKALRDGDMYSACSLFEQSAGVPEAEPNRADDSRAEAGFACISQYWQSSNKSYLFRAEAIFKPLAAKSQTNPQSVRARMGLGEIRLIQGDGKGASEHYQAVLDSKQPDKYIKAVAQFELACTYYVKQQWVEAIAGFDQFLDAQPGKSPEEKHKNWLAAKPFYAKTAMLDPAKAKKLTGTELVPNALYWKGEALYHLNRYQEAKDLADQVLKSFPDLAIDASVKDLQLRCKYLLPKEVK